MDGLLSTARSPHSIVPSAAVIPSDWTEDGTSPAEQENTVADDSGRIGMSMLRFGCALFAVAVIACAAHGAQAEVTRVEIAKSAHRSEEHTSELQSHLNLVSRLLLEKKTNTYHINH